MKTTRNRRVLVFAFLLAATLLASIAYAGLIVVYPITATVTEYKPPVVFVKGSNADRTGLWGSPLTVNLGDNMTSATLTLQATYQTTYIHDILKIVNNDPNNSYYVAVRVDTPISPNCNISKAYMILRNTTYPLSIDLTTSTNPTNIQEIILPANGFISVDFKFNITEGSIITNETQCTLNLKLIYSPESGNAKYAPVP